MTAPEPNRPPLPDEVAWTLERVDGFLDLCMLDRARRELASVPEVWRDDDRVMRMRLRLAIEAQDWPEAAQLARRLADREPEEPLYWIQWAYAARRCESIESAHGILREAREKFPKTAMIPFNLACYECRLGRLAEARTFLQTAFELNPALRDLAAEDDDLEPLWPEITD